MVDPLSNFINDVSKKIIKWKFSPESIDIFLNTLQKLDSKRQKCLFFAAFRLNVNEHFAEKPIVCLFMFLQLFFYIIFFYQNLSDISEYFMVFESEIR